MPEVVTSDGVRIAYTDRGRGRPLVLLHGWTFSGRFFDDVAAPLAERFRVVTPDLRGHGESEDPGHGYRVARLAADLRDLLDALDLRDAVVLGWSLGCAVVWQYLELFGTERVGGVVYAAQPPRQYIAVDWPWTHAECFDEAGAAALLARVTADPAAEDRRQLTAIRTTEPDDAERDRLLTEMGKCPVGARVAVMTDHTRHDWRDLLPTLAVPTLVCVAEQDKVFDPRGPAWVGEHVPGARTERFPDAGHAFFLDEPEHFVAAVTGFAAPGAGGGGS